MDGAVPPASASAVPLLCGLSCGILGAADSILQLGGGLLSLTLGLRLAIAQGLAGSIRHARFACCPAPSTRSLSFNLFSGLQLAGYQGSNGARRMRLRAHCRFRLSGHLAVTVLGGEPVAVLTARQAVQRDPSSCLLG